MSKDFMGRQQEIIHDDMRTMPPEMVNEILADMTQDEANVFLYNLGHTRAADIYASYEEPGCLETIGLRLLIVLSVSAFCFWLLWQSAFC